MRIKIVSDAQLEHLSEGDVLLLFTEGKYEQFYVSQVNDDNILVVHQDGLLVMKAFPLERLIKDDWWLPDGFIVKG